MSTSSPSPAQARGRYGAAIRHLGPDDPRIEEARRNLAAATIEAFVERKLAEAPVLSDDQVERIAARLRGPSGAVG